MKRHKRYVGSVILLLFVFFCGLSKAASLTGLLDQVLFSDSAAIEVSITPEIVSLPAMGPNRLEILNQLMKHLKLRITRNPPYEQVGISVDDADALLVTAKKAEDGTEVRFSSVPDQLYYFEHRSSLSEVLLNGNPDPSVQIHAETVWHLLDEGNRFLTELPELFEDLTRSSRIRQKLKMGTAVRKVSVTVSADHIPDGKIPRLTEASSGYSRLHRLLSRLVFKGRQQLVLFYDEQGSLLKANYSGTAGFGEDRFRNISLEWKCLRAPERIRDELTLRTPSPDGNHRNNLILSRDWAIRPDGEECTVSGQYDLKDGGRRTLTKWTAEVRAAEDLSGSFQWTDTGNGDTQVHRISFHMNDPGDTEYHGTVNLAGELNKLTQYQLCLNFDGAPAPDPVAVEPGSGRSVTVAENSPLYGTLLDTMVHDVLSAVVRLPQSETVYLNGDIPSGQWQQIIQPVMK